MKSEGQAAAIAELEEIAAASTGAFEIVEVVEAGSDGASATIVVSIECRGFPHRPGGIRLRVRERIQITIPWRFPLARADAKFTHDRYGGTPHVQWGNQMCLYQAPEIEWQPARGAIGFTQRLFDWLKAAAAGELDPVGMPLHPPVAYQVASFSVVPHVDTPVPEDPFWAGYVSITAEDDVVAELGDWVRYDGVIPDGGLVTAILLPTTMPFEYPKTVRDLILALITRGVPLRAIRAVINLGVLRSDMAKPALFLLGAAMRGTAGGDRLQHLACWRIPAAEADKLRVALAAATAENPHDEDAFLLWAVAADVEWCRVLEDRPKIVERRDSKSPASFWRGKRVGLLGCGAIGSHLALMLARAGVAQLELYDNGIVTPGILVRQNFRRRSLGRTKCSAVKVAVELANPDVNASDHYRDIPRVFEDAEAMAVLMGLDVVIDATASNSVATAMELYFRRHTKNHPPVIAMALGHNADMAMMTLSTRAGAGMSLDLDRRTKLALANSGKSGAFLEEFWPTAPDRSKLFQPEPGCSSPTFRGSATDVLGLTARMANFAAEWLGSAPPVSPRTFGMNLSGPGPATGPAREIEIAFEPDQLLNDGRHSFQIRQSREARAAMLSWIRRSERTRGSRTETGGILFGEVDAFLKTVWINEVSGPPPDSTASPEGFVCGTAGVPQMHAEKLKRSRGSVSFVGMWHTHPHGLPNPSPTDLGAMRELLKPNSDFLGRRFLMMIIGGTSQLPIASASMFDRSDYS